MYKKRNSLLFVVLLLFYVVGCKPSNGYRVSGTFLNAADSLLYLEKLTSSGSDKKDTIAIDSTGKFLFKGDIDEGGIFSVRDNKRRGPIIILDKGSSVQLNFDANDIENYDVRGNKASKDIKTLFSLREHYGSIINELNAKRVEVAGDSVEHSRIRNEIKDYGNKFVEEVKEQIRKADPLAGLTMIRMVRHDENMEFHEELAERLQVKYSDNMYTKDFVAYVEGKTTKVKAPIIGENYRDIDMKNPEGKSYKLSDLKGSYILLDFWAAWCRPCRAENPNIVKAYEQYKDKNFTIYSVSLDRTKKAWIRAIEKDNLNWPYHVSDFKYWNSKAAKEYGVASIPANFLIDPEGKIIARNLRGPFLHNRLKEIFK